ncbi:MAG: HlyD family efflux transporter periplasmic adaptor subunit [Terrimesophilobacter sp.]
MRGKATVGVWRRWIFPIIRIVIFAAIAVALVKVAFYPDTPAVHDPAVPGAEIVEPQIAVTVGVVHNDVMLDGSVAADAAVPAKSPAMGTVHKVFVTVDQTVAAGDKIMTIWTEVPRDDGSIRFRESTVTAPAAGVVSSVALMVDQMASVGDVVAQIAPPTFHVTATLMAEQQYRLTTQPTEAQVSIVGGPAPFTCTGLKITTAASGADGTSGGTSVTCAVPAEVRVFSGLSASMTIAGGIAENVLVVPVTAVEGSADTGNVYFLLPDGSTEMRPVVLGLSDGFNVEIKEGLAEGDMILQFVPGAPSDGGVPMDDGPVPPIGK